jgi:hypothetical protein
VCLGRRAGLQPALPSTGGHGAARCRQPRSGCARPAGQRRGVATPSAAGPSAAALDFGSFDGPGPSGRQEEPLSAYVHLPFCNRKCFYCSFPVLAVGARHDQPHVQSRMEVGAWGLDWPCGAAAAPSAAACLQPLPVP